METAEIVSKETDVVKKEDLEVRAAILGIQELIAKSPDAKYGDYLPLKHTFAEGIYVREILIPKGELLVGKIHKHSHPNFLMKGEVSVLTEEDGAVRLKAPMSMISSAGTKRVVYAHEDTVWITVHKTDETDLEKIEEEVIAKDYNELMPKCVDGFLKDINEGEQK